MEVSHIINVIINKKVGGNMEEKDYNYLFDDRELNNLEDKPLKVLTRQEQKEFDSKIKEILDNWIIEYEE